MPADPTSDIVNGRQRSRAKKACKACNSRRVRCNVMEEQPCKNCKTGDVSCELMKSRRGKYVLKPFPGASYSNGSEKDVDDSTSERAARETTISLLHTAAASTTSPRTPVNAADTVFLGESSSISLVHGPSIPSAAYHSSPAEKTRLRYPIPDAVSTKTSTTPFEERRKAARLDYLTRDGAFAYPSNEICEVLLEAYFQWFHPCFPILDRHTFFNSYITKTISPLLLKAVLFVGATHCNETVMRDLGFPSRMDARTEMYNHIKDIYDADYETDKITVSQALFLLSFWRAGPLLEKDTRHWLGAAINLAQTKGMHRSSSTTTFTDFRLRKRIWWSLYVRDRQCSTALGLPSRIRDDDCDIEMLDPSDFEEEDHSTYPKYLGFQKKEHVLFAIQMAKLAVYLGRIILREFSPTRLSKNNSERSRLRDDLFKWESELSPEMMASATADSFWATYLAKNDDQSAGNVALQAACRNTRITEDVLAQDLVQHLNVHMYNPHPCGLFDNELILSRTTSLFNSLCIHTICLRRSQNATRKLAEYRAQLCLLGLRELQKTWDVTNWVLQLFLQFLDQSTAKRLQLMGDNEDMPAQQPISASASSLRTMGTSVVDLDFAVRGNAAGYGLARGEDTSIPESLDYMADLFGTKEAQDFSMFQLQPDLFGGDLFGGGLDQYYNTVMPRGEGSNDLGFR
ncbi:Cutinase transcription factor 1 alpha [Hyphodiscus hymeniophilus]|uniref:Cutinase transcription factor 1 alpha n=1 Tax=Hyphodiscus hymeniophilus TaxID=353542 RepID=A0A9P6VK50_9HELO|nr:Cutinase transcription factor 1 alpha [Hyphodiscus hymeniophilus]